MVAKTTKKFADASSHVNSDELEQAVLAYWEKENIFARSLAQTKTGERFTFYDGPPYATGKPHYGHILQSAIKDSVLRYKTMQGYHVPRRVGWDCHGLPVETLVEKELGIKTKKDIEKLGIEKFNTACRDVVFRYINEFTSTLKRVGRWADYDDAYATLNREYMESEWWVFQQLWDKELVYKAFRSTPYCIRCATPLSNFEVSMGYKDTTDPAIYVLLKVSPKSLPHAAKAPRGGRGANKQLSLLIWTTTPWTLPGNVAVAINPEITYVEIVDGDKNIIIAQDRAAKVFKNAPIVTTWSARELQQLTYEPLYDFLKAKNAFRVVAAKHVTAQDGSGLVHMAPAFGEEDHQVAKEQNLPVLRTVDTNGAYIPEVSSWAGENIFAAQPKIIADLKQRGLLLRQEQFTHSYPFCWRCDEPLIYYALDSWFIKITALKERMLAINEKINWVPEHVKAGRFKKGIESAPDWAVSRNRYWSVPLPIWECDQCEARECLGSIKDLQERSGVAEINDLHRPYVDAYTWPCKKCEAQPHSTKATRGTVRRVPEVLDVWFDSGSMPYAQWHYPFEHKQFVEEGYPAHFIAESIEMTRAWFYVLHVLATALTAQNIGLGQDQPAYQNVIASGLIFAEDGRKLSKKLKNYPEIEPTLQQYGADVLRLYLLTSTSLGEPYRFSERDLKQLQRNTYMTLWNVYSFFVSYANAQNWQPAATAPVSTNLLDRWMMARVHQLEQEVIAATDTYHVDQAARLFITYVDDLSNWYVRRSRQRFHPANVTQEAADKTEAFSTLYTVLTHTAVVLAPFMPFVTDAIFRNLTGKDSVHLESFPLVAAVTAKEQTLLDEMRRAREIVSLGLSLRAQASLKIRQPLAQLLIPELKLSPELLAIIADEVNVKAVIVGDPHGTLEYVWSAPEAKHKVGLATTLTNALRDEGIVREIIRHGQALRREAGYALGDHIVVMAATDQETLRELLRTHATAIQEALQADELLFDVTAADTQTSVSLGSDQLTLGVKRPV